MASTSVAIICNSIHSGHPWQTLCIRVKEWDKRPFILILDWILVNVTLIMLTNLSPFSNFCKAEKTKSLSALWKIFIQLIWHIDYVANSRKSMQNCSFFLIAADWFPPIIASNAFCSRFLRIVVYGSVVCNVSFITFSSIWVCSSQCFFYHLFYIWLIWFQF